MFRANRQHHLKLKLIFEIPGFHATTAEEYAAAFDKALSLKPKDVLDMRLRARESAKRFSEEVFVKNWLEQMAKLVALNRKSRQ